MNNTIIDFRTRPLLFIDLEFSGLDPRIHEILEVGAIVVDPTTLEIKKEYEVKTKPLHIENADPKALDINGYKKEDWENAVEISEALNNLNQIAPNGMIVGWNVAYDCMFLDMAYRNNNIKPAFDYHKIDILALGWKYALTHPEIADVKLSGFCKHFGIDRKNAHTAMADIKATYEVFIRLISQNQAEKER
ncbi:3'-5' exonuclease [Candidatus Microgenomates bacterium]|nr:3'-5' exonuclease [Candidatus Microgenomates bacterium]